MKSYIEFQKIVFNWLMNKHNQDSLFTFSVRQVASKGAELNYFIGTEKSEYFSTTFWSIQVNYPGSSSDLINLVFELNSDSYSYHIQFNQTRSPFNDQNRFALEFIRSIKEKVRDFRGFYENDPTNKIEYFHVGDAKAKYFTESELFTEIEKDMSKLLPIIDEELIRYKTENPEFKAEKISKAQFDLMIVKLEKRRAKYAALSKGSAQLVESIVEVPVLTKPITKIQYPLNQILYGPPGTGKTYKLQTEFINQFIVTNKKQTKEEFVADEIKNLSWWQVLTMILLEGKTTVPEIKKHKYIKYKLSVSNTRSLDQTIWGQLSSHTIQDSKTVSYTKRFDPLFLNKTQDSVWFIDETKKDLISDLVELSNKIKTFKDEVVSENNWKFTTFHQSMSYEDFIEGIKPVSLEDEAEGDLKYHIEKGIFYECCDEAARLAGFLSLKDALMNHSKEERKKRFSEAGNFALFIDEINRGNIAAIFGELITLIEDDKRLGKNEIIVELPYSKGKFGVPPNLYIIGTMNTADRSVEALDAALRRRFSFEEMPPKPELVAKDMNGINLSKVLETINKRIEVLLDKDHQIGHSYFMSVSNMVELKSAFQNKIIPLLQEYFFGDYGKIGLVLGSGFVTVEKNTDSKTLFASFDDSYDAADLADRAIYKITNVADTDFDIKAAIESLLN